MMRKISMFSAFAGIVLVSGCATQGSITRAKAPQGNAIVIATFDSRYSDGKAVSDNAGGLPGQVVGGGGALGALVNVVTGLAINATSSALTQASPYVNVKVIFEDTCADLDYVTTSLNHNPEVLKLAPGAMARLEFVPDLNRWKARQVVTETGDPVYLTKGHRCYTDWVRELKQHRQNLASHLSWTHQTSKYSLGLNRKPLSELPDPEFDYIK